MSIKDLLITDEEMEKVDIDYIQSVIKSALFTRIEADLLSSTDSRGNVSVNILVERLTNSDFKKEISSIRKLIINRIKSKEYANGVLDGRRQIINQLVRTIPSE